MRNVAGNGKDAKWKRKNEAHQKTTNEKSLADNKKWFADNLESARKKLREDLGVMTGANVSPIGADSVYGKLIRTRYQT